MVRPTNCAESVNRKAAGADGTVTANVSSWPGWEVKLSCVADEERIAGVAHEIWQHVLPRSVRNVHIYPRAALQDRHGSIYSDNSQRPLCNTSHHETHPLFNI